MSTRTVPTLAPIALRNAVVRTMSLSVGVARGLVVQGGQVVSVHDDSDEAPATGSVIDLHGMCVIPGITDSHVHFLRWATAQRQLRLEGCASLEDAVHRVGRAASDHGSGWLLGHGWRPGDWTPAREPTARDLDPVTGAIPVALRSKDGHSLWLNSAALAKANGDLATPGGVVELDEHGQPSGVLREESAWRFETRNMILTDEESLAATREGVRIANARGVTAVHDLDGLMGAMGIWQRLHAEGGLTLRVWQGFQHERLDAAESLSLRAGLGDDHLKAGYLKVFMDGSLGSGTAHLLDGSGVEITSPARLDEIVRRASAAGWGVAIHAIGDRAIRNALDVLQATRDVWAPTGLRPRIEHAQLVHPDDIHRFAAIGVACSVQFVHAPSDRDLVDEAWAGVAEHAYPFRSLLDSGALMVSGSDAPIEELDPLLGLRAAVLRTLDERPAWHPEQALTVEQALMTMTANPAELCGDGGRRGRLVPGHSADLVVLDRDPVACPAEELADIRVVATMVGGRWVSGMDEGDPLAERLGALAVGATPPAG